MAMSHANCLHAATSAGRRECRSLGGPAGWAAANSNAINKPTGMPEPVLTDRMAAMGRAIAEVIADPNAAVARGNAGTESWIMAHGTKAARRRVETRRIQPRRGGARVPARSSACVQAALHIDEHGGRCACGWEAVAA